MYIKRASADRGHVKYNWLDSYHTFSFDSYYDPRFMGFGNLRVINEDIIEPGQGFPTHGHKDMEIITYVIEGMLEHKDSLNNGGTISPGEIQRMSAGSGITHSEFNASKTAKVHLLQIWILPKQVSVKPAYEQINFQKNNNTLAWRLLVSEQGEKDSVKIGQDVRFYDAKIPANKALTFTCTQDKKYWLQLIKGVVAVHGILTNAGDGIAITDEKDITINGVEDAKVLLIET